jgi:hypothetical protein
LLEEAEHFAHNQKASVATLSETVRLQLGMLFGVFRKHRSPSPDFPNADLARIFTSARAICQASNELLDIK